MFERMTKWLTLLATALSFLLGSVEAAEKITFWDTPRKGANGFNVEPTEAWFAAARGLGVDWVRLAYAKWKGQHRDFLIGDADNFQGVVPEDMAELIEVLDWAQKYNIKVVITPLGLPGNRWIQNNDNRRDLKLWNNKAYWQQSAAFWAELATSLKNHPAVCAYNILNEPTPEMKTGLDEHGDVSRYKAWYEKYRGTAHDLPAFYETVIAAIRKVDSQTPIMLDTGWYAQPNAFVYWPRIDDDKVLYAFHMYEPYQFTNHRNYRREKPYVYPGKIPYAATESDWNKGKIEDYLTAFLGWAKAREVPGNRLVCGEFGCYRRNPGAAAYLADVIDVLNEHDLHWAFYSFREDACDGYDYELGTAGLGAAYWQAKEAGENPPLTRRDNPLFDIIKRQSSSQAVRSADAIEDAEVRRFVMTLSSDEWLERESAAYALADMGWAAKAAIPYLTDRLGDEEWRVRKAAAIALTPMGSEATPAVPYLIAALDDGEWHVRKSAADALGAIGLASKDALPALRECLNDPEEQVRRAATDAIEKIIGRQR